MLHTTVLGLIELIIRMTHKERAFFCVTLPCSYPPPPLAMLLSPFPPGPISLLPSPPHAPPPPHTHTNTMGARATTPRGRSGQPGPGPPWWPGAPSGDNELATALPKRGGPGAATDCPDSQGHHGILAGRHCPDSQGHHGSVAGRRGLRIVEGHMHEVYKR